MQENRKPDDLTYASYVTIAIDENPDKGLARIDKFLEAYYGAPGPVMRKRMASFAGSAEEAAAFVKSYVDGGASHICIRFAGDHESSLKAMSALRAQMGG